jgi:hypothetical protein
MAFNASLAELIRHVFARKKGIEEMHLLPAERNHAMIIGLRKESVIARLSRKLGEKAVLGPHVREMDNAGEPMNGSASVEVAGEVAGEVMFLHSTEMPERRPKGEDHAESP